MQRVAVPHVDVQRLVGQMLHEQTTFTRLQIAGIHVVLDLNKSDILHLLMTSAQQQSQWHLVARRTLLSRAVCFELLQQTRNGVCVGSHLVLRLAQEKSTWKPLNHE